MENLGSYNLKAVEVLQIENETIDIIEGCLLDSILLYSPQHNKYVACLEHPLNTWCSCFQVYVGDEEEIYNMWNQYKEERIIIL